MNADLAAFLARQTPRAWDEAVWGDGRMTLHLTTYLTSLCPPLAYITSVRTLLFYGNSLMVLCNAGGAHIVPGGRREAGETLVETLRREVLEETGWTITAPHLLGFTHFHQQNPPLPEFAQSPYPDFVQIVHMAEADTWRPEAKLTDDYEGEAEFRPLAEVQRLTLSPGERVYLQAALERRATLGPS